MNIEKLYAEKTNDLCIGQCASPMYFVIVGEHLIFEDDNSFKQQQHYLKIWRFMFGHQAQMYSPKMAH